MNNKYNQQRTYTDLTENKQHNSHCEQKAITLRLPEPRDMFQLALVVVFVLVHITPFPTYTSIVILQFLPVPEGSEPEHLFLDSIRQS